MKGEPDFTSISDERLKDFIDLAQEMILAYKYYDEEKVRVMTDIWKHMSDNYTARMCSSACVESKCQVKAEGAVPPAIHKIKMAKRIKR